MSRKSGTSQERAVPATFYGRGLMNCLRNQPFLHMSSSLLPGLTLLGHRELACVYVRNGFVRHVLMFVRGLRLPAHTHTCRERDGVCFKGAGWDVCVCVMTCVVCAAYLIWFDLTAPLRMHTLPPSLSHFSLSLPPPPSPFLPLPLSLPPFSPPALKMS